VLMQATTVSCPALCAETDARVDDLTLVEAPRHGDVTGFDELVRRYDRKLLRIAQTVTHNTEDAEEAVQEAFLKAYQKLNQFQGNAKFSTWLVRITLNESFMKLRKQHGIPKQSIDSDAHADSGKLPLDVADWAPSPEALYGASELRKILIHCLQRLTPTLKIVFVLRDIEEHSISKTSEILNLTETAVKTRLFRARLRLREELSTYFRKSD